MMDYRPPTDSEPAVDDLKRRNDEAFNRLDQMVRFLKELLGRDRDQDPDSFSGTTPSHS
jgi:hypothetical protein